LSLLFVFFLLSPHLSPKQFFGTMKQQQQRGSGVLLRICCLLLAAKGTFSFFPSPGLSKVTYSNTCSNIPFQKKQSLLSPQRQPSPLKVKADLESQPLPLVGEDAAVFELSEQKLKSWGIFGVLLTTVLGALYFFWINNDTGLGDDYIHLLETIAQGDSQAVMALLLVIFGIVHSGLASLRPAAEEIIGARAWRVIFALSSLPIATSSIVYFINHRYEGQILWNLKDVPGMHSFCWIVSFISFWFLYPSTFNLLEVAAVDKPKLHMWETGIMRITRHPQMVGQFLWCLAHTLWIGSSFMCVATAGLMAHHLFGCWNGDRRLEDKYGEAFLEVKERTSTLPFQAIIEGRQQLPKDYYKEFLRGPYLIITVATIGAYFVHPFMQAGSYLTHW